MKTYKVISLLLIFLLSGCSERVGGNGYIIIKNNSNYPISDVSVNYTSAKRKDSLGKIAPHSSYKYSIYLKHEDSINLSYKTIDQQIHIRPVSGYLSTAEKVKVLIEIN